jgi:hypothetical protein
MFLTIKLFLLDIKSLVGGLPGTHGWMSGNSDRLTVVTRIAMQVCVTLTILVVCFIVTRNPSKHQSTHDIAWAAMGTVIGYWLR